MLAIGIDPLVARPGEQVVRGGRGVRGEQEIEIGGSAQRVIVWPAECAAGHTFEQNERKSCALEQRNHRSGRVIDAQVPRHRVECRRAQPFRNPRGQSREPIAPLELVVQPGGNALELGEEWKQLELRLVREGNRLAEAHRGEEKRGEIAPRSLPTGTGKVASTWKVSRRSVPDSR